MPSRVSPSSGFHSLADEVELLAQRLGRGRGRRAQQFQQAHRLGAGQRDQRPGGEILRQLLRHLPVDGLLRERLVCEQLLKRLECLVAIRRPQQQQFFERRLAVRNAAGRALQPLLRRLLAAHHALPREMLDEGQQQLVQRLGTGLRAEEAESVGHDARGQIARGSAP